MDRLKVEEIIRKIRKVDIKTRKLVSESFLGSYHSRFKGRGIEFSEVTDYRYGDDIRSIDWNVTARMCQPYIKKFVESRELSINIIMDISKSMDYGSADIPKRELAVEAAGAVAFSAIRNNDKVGLILVSDQVEFHLPPGKGYQHLFRLIREALFFNPENRGSSITPGLEFMSSVYSRKQIAFVVSDFFGYTPDRRWHTAMRRRELIPLIIEDIREEELAGKGLLSVEDLETGEEYVLSLSAASGLWKERARAERDNLLRMFRRMGQDCIIIGNSEQIVPELTRYFNKRKSP